MIRTDVLINPCLYLRRAGKKQLYFIKKISNDEARQNNYLFESVQLPNPAALFLLNCHPHQLLATKATGYDRYGQRVEPHRDDMMNPYRPWCKQFCKTIFIKKIAAAKQYSTFITHEILRRNEIADKVVVMYKGTLLKKGAAKDIYSNPTLIQSTFACCLALHPKGEIVVMDFMMIKLKALHHYFNKLQEETPRLIEKLKLRTPSQF